MITEHKFYVYVDYTTEIKPRPFYVGKGVLSRIKNLKPRNKLHSNIKSKFGLERKIAFGPISESEAFEKEKFLIQELKTYFYGHDCWGCNFTHGGDGSSGHHAPPLTDEHKNSLRKANSHPKSLETKEKMKAAAKKRSDDPEWRLKMKEVSKERWKSDEYRALISTSSKGKTRSKEQKENFSIAQKKSWENVEKRRKASSSAKKRFLNPEEKKRLSEKLRNLWKDPEYRAMMKKARKKETLNHG